MKKADDKVSFEEDGSKPEKYTNFEHLKAMVEVLKGEVELIAGILKQNNLVFKEETEADTDIEDETFKKLEED